MSLRATAAHIQLQLRILSVEQTDCNLRIFTHILFRQMCVSFFNSRPPIGSRAWTYALPSLSEKTQKSNHLQMLQQRQHLLLNYFKNSSVTNWSSRESILACRAVDWRYNYNIVPYQTKLRQSSPFYTLLRYVEKYNLRFCQRRPFELL